MTPRRLRNEIARILIKWSMPTRWVAINEIAELMQPRVDHKVMTREEEIIALYEQVAIGAITPAQAREGFIQIVGEVLIAVDVLAIHLARKNNQVIGENQDYYVTLEQLNHLLMQIRDGKT